MPDSADCVAPQESFSEALDDEIRKRDQRLLKEFEERLEQVLREVFG